MQEVQVDIVYQIWVQQVKQWIDSLITTAARWRNLDHVE